MFEYKTEKLLSTHSFGTHQISVITLSDSHGDSYKGIAVSPIPYSLFSEATFSEAMGDYGKPLIIEEKQSLLLCQFIEEVLSGSLPKKIEVESNGPPLKIKLKKYIKNWHEGGGYKCSVCFGRFGGFDFLSSTIVSKKSLVRLRNSLIDLYELKKMVEMNA